MDEYAQNALNEIDALIGGQEQALSIPYSKLAKATVDVINNQAKPIVKMIDKMLRAADMALVNQGNALDAVQTRVLMGLDAYLQDQEYLLQNLAVKGGVIGVGDPLQAALTQEATTGPELAYLGTLVLEIGQLAPILTRIAVAVETLAGLPATKDGAPTGAMADLIEVLREIRDRQGQPPTRTQGELASGTPTELVTTAILGSYYE